MSFREEILDTLRRLSPHPICASCICDMLRSDDTDYIRDVCRKAAAGGEPGFERAEGVCSACNGRQQTWIVTRFVPPIPPPSAEGE